MSFSDKHIFFDLDRTLWDFDKNSKNALKLIIEAENLTSIFGSFDRFHRAYVKNNIRLWGEYGKGKLKKDVLRYERFHATLKQFGTDDIQLAKKMGDAYVEISPRQKILLPNTIPVLQELTKIGFQLHIITNGFVEVQFIKLENCGLRDFFKVIVCSEVVGKNKPAIAIYNYALEKANCAANDALMIGDDYVADVSGALNAGLQAVLFDPVMESKEHYTHTINDLKEFPEIAVQLLR
jgi:putative hydrolase of the HAD superfamily